MDKNNIILIGFSGCGKTTIGKRLAKIKGFKFTDTDIELETEAKIPVTAIFEKFGEDYFRRLEAEIIQKTTSGGNTVIATGGGCIKSIDNMKRLSETGIIVYLKCDAGKIYENIKDDNSRPLLQYADKRKRIEELLNERTPLYEQYAEVTVDISDCNVFDAAERLNNAIDCFKNS